MEIYQVTGDQLPTEIAEQIIDYNVNFEWSPAITQLSFTNAVEFLLVLADEVLCGYTSFMDGGDFLEIHLFYVAEDYRRQGLAQALLEELVAIADERQASTLVLEVRSRNEAARALYEGFGFECIHTRPNYYRRPQDDALILQYRRSKDKGGNQ